MLPMEQMLLPSVQHEIKEAEARVELERKTTDVLRFLLTLSVTLQTLLLPLASLVSQTRQSRYLLCGAVVALLCSSLTSLAGVLYEFREIRARVDHHRAAKEGYRGAGKFPEHRYIRRSRSRLWLATGAGTCFGLAVLLLCGTLFQILFS